MGEIDKLRILLEHWMEHNHEHADTYIQWADKVRAEGDAKLSEMLMEIAAEAKKMDTLFDRARKAIDGRQS